MDNHSEPFKQFELLYLVKKRGAVVRIQNHYQHLSTNTTKDEEKSSYHRSTSISIPMQSDTQYCLEEREVIHAEKLVL